MTSAEDIHARQTSQCSRHRSRYVAGLLGRHRRDPFLRRGTLGLACSMETRGHPIAYIIYIFASLSFRVNGVTTLVLASQAASTENRLNKLDSPHGSTDAAHKNTRCLLPCLNLSYRQCYKEAYNFSIHFSVCITKYIAQVLCVCI